MTYPPKADIKVNKKLSYIIAVFRRIKLTRCEVTIMDEKKGFWSCLFDLSFDELITMRIIKALYAIGILIAGIAAIWIFVEMLSQKGIWVLLYFIAIPITFILVVIIARVKMELLLTLFRIEENTRKPAPAEEASAPEPVEEAGAPEPAEKPESEE